MKKSSGAAASIGFGGASWFAVVAVVVLVAWVHHTAAQSCNLVDVANVCLPVTAPPSQKCCSALKDRVSCLCELSNTALSLQQETRLKQMGATVRNASSYMEKLRMNEKRENLARNVMNKMSVEQLSDLMSFYHMMGQIYSEVLERKLTGIVNELTS